ncbi:methyl-accepting chemotaxis protein [Tahibacter amnicola]|nr:methyl-accepting chemotaxis protein [Tahibacter amnicola]
MKNLTVWQKLLLIGFVFLIPFALVTYRMLASVDKLGIEFARQEVRGLDYYQVLFPLLNDLQQHLGLALVATSGDAGSRDRLFAKATEINATLQRMEKVDHALDANLHLTGKWQRIAASVRELVQQTPSLGSAELLEAHGKLFGDIVAQITAAGDASNLTLDPDLDSYYLMNILIFQGPELSNVIANASEIIATAGDKPLSADQVDRLGRLATLMEYLQGNLDLSLAKAFEANATLKPQLEGVGAILKRAATEEIVATAAVARGLKDGRSAADRYAVVQSSLRALRELTHQAQQSLRNLIDIRIAKFQSEIYATLAWAILAFLVATLVAAYMMRDIVQALRQVVGTATKIATGDLTALADVDRRKDEIGELTKAFDLMVTSLREKVLLVEDIADGNLTGTVTTQSTHDDMGNALENMVSGLKTLVGEVHRSGIHVNSAVNQIAAASKEQQATAAEIAATTTEVSVTSKEISATSRELVKTMTEVAGVADQTASLAGGGQVALSHMEETMRRVMDAAGSINAKLAVLNEKAGNINQVVTTITKVADQTNLLSLNAAIEAEKAGEYGRGFSVVATEIRRLADQTAVATFDIEQMVKEIQSAVAAGVMGMDMFSEEVRRGISDVQQVSTQLSQIINDVQALAPRFESVNEGMQAQANGAEQITQALTQLSEAAQQTVETLRTSSQAVDDLNQAASSLRGGVARFKLEK